MADAPLSASGSAAAASAARVDRERLAVGAPNEGEQVAADPHTAGRRPQASPPHATPRPSRCHRVRRRRRRPGSQPCAGLRSPTGSCLRGTPWPQVSSPHEGGSIGCRRDPTRMRRARCGLGGPLAGRRPRATDRECRACGPGRLSGDVLVPRGAVVGEVVVLSGSATIEGVAQGNVVVSTAARSPGRWAGTSSPCTGRSTARDGPGHGRRARGCNLVAVDGAQVTGEVRARRQLRFLSRPADVLGSRRSVWRWRSRSCSSGCC